MQLHAKFYNFAVICLNIMLLDTFTIEELISALKKAVVIFKDRVHNYRDANTKVLSKKLKNGNFNRTHSGITSDANLSHR